jgi:hypothetical protein
MTVKEMHAESTKPNVAFMALASGIGVEENQAAIAKMCIANNIKKV